MRNVLTVCFGALALLFAHSVSAQESPADFFRNDLHANSAQPSSPSLNPGAVPGQDSSSARNTPAQFAAAAQRHGVPIGIAMATIKHESGGRCNARGRAGELGPLQIKPATARGLGYRGPASELATCGAGLEWGMRHLALAYKKCGHVGPHNSGLGSGCRRTAYVNKVMRSV